MTEKLPYSHIDKGMLLVATPDVELGLFFRSVILICEHNTTGSFGIVLNKPLEIEMPEEIIDMSQMSNPHVGIRAGGPIQTNQMMLLHTSSENPAETLNICEGVWLGGDLDFLQELITDEEGPEVLLCFGYSGWGAGQLEREFLDGGWLLWPCRKEHIFDVPPERLWQSLLREMGGKYATLSMIPEDLSLN